MTSPMKPQHKLASLAAIPLAFVITFVVAFLVMGLADAVAQPVEALPQTGNAIEPSPEPRFVPPSDDPIDEAGTTAPTVGGDTAAAGDHGAHGAGGAEAHGGHGDPTKHFNYFGFSYRGKDIAGGKLGDGKNIDPVTGEVVGGEEEAMSAPFVLMVLNFLLLVGLLVWKGGPIARKLAIDRHDLIKNALDEAAKLREQAAAKLAEYETKLKAADAEIKQLVDGMRDDAAADKARILANAEVQAAHMKRDAERRIAAEIEIARALLTREVTAAAATATEKLLRDKMVPGDQQQLVSQFITGVQAATHKERV